MSHHLDFFRGGWNKANSRFIPVAGDKAGEWMHGSGEQARYETNGEDISVPRFRVFPAQPG
jgi:hypothetical protein